MKIALITTTINIPRVLKLYRACSPNVAFFVAGDLKTPTDAAMGSDPPHYMSPDYQRALGYKCSDLIGWNTIARRNIALLEALKWGADIIVSIDDDNIPLSTDYFDRYEMVLSASIPPASSIEHTLFSGCSIYGFNGWFDPGQLAYPHEAGVYASQRGFPHEKNQGTWGIKPIVNAKVGVAQGLILGDPDTSAVDRIAWRPEVHRVSELARAGVVLDNNTYAPLNSQNIAFVCELAPCFLMIPQFGRYDDIFASLIAQRVMRETGHVVHFGQPFVWQQRNAHDFNQDLAAELWGMQHVVEFASWLDRLYYKRESFTWPVTDMLRDMWDDFHHCAWCPPGVGELASAWLQDIESVL